MQSGGGELGECVIEDGMGEIVEKIEQYEKPNHRKRNDIDKRTQINGFQKRNI